MAKNADMGTRRAKNTLLSILLAILAFNYVDSQALALVLQNIKSDLKLSDAQLGFISGIGFAAFHAVMGIPLARLADRGNRVTIISATIFIWSAFLVACGAATSFVQLFLIRIGVAVGEAGCIPPAQSLLSDFFPREERARAFAIYSLGSPLSVIIGGFGAGWINEYYGWRATFVILGCPGILLAVLAWVMLRDPRRAVAGGRLSTEAATQPSTGKEPRGSQCAGESANHPSFVDVVRALTKNATFRQLLIANTILYFFIYGALQWQPSFFIRTHGFTTGELGTWDLLIWSLMGTLGTYAGGAIVHRFLASDERRQLRLISVSIALFGTLNALIYLSSHRYMALGMMVIAAPFYTAIMGPMLAVNQSVVPEKMRATAVALMLFFGNLVGMGLGGLVTGLLSDALAPVYGSDSLRYSLLALSPGFLWCAVHFWCASRTVALDVESALREAEPAGLQAAP